MCDDRLPDQLAQVITTYRLHDRNREPASTRQLCHGFGVWQRRAGFDRHVRFHVLRHSACSAIYHRTKDIRLTQRFARRKSILTTAVYSHPTVEDLHRAVDVLPC